MKRTEMIDAVRPFAPGGKLSHGMVVLLDQAADLMGLPRVNDAPPLTPSRKAAALIKEFEGCRLTAYPDPGSGGDPWTIGWGSTGPDIRKGTVWTQEQADARFAEHLEEFGQGVAQLIGKAPTTQSQFDAMVSLAYNIGLGNFRESTLLRRHKEGAYAGAAIEFARWTKAAGKVLPGLVRRRAAEADLYRGKS